MEWLKRVLRGAFEDATKSLLSTLFIMIFTYGATRLWQHISDKYFPSNDLIRITTVSLQEGHVGEQYKSTLTAEVDGVIREVEWSFDSLPLGLYLNGEVIEGIPQVAGQYALTVIATNGTISDSRTLPLNIKESPTSSQKQEAITTTDGESILPKQQKPVEIINKVTPLNDKVSTAISLQSRIKYSGNLVKKYDTRYYSLNLEAPTAVNFVFNAAGLSSYSWSIQGSKNLHEQNSEESGCVNIVTELYNDSKNIAENFNIYLRPGNYLIKITGGKVWRDKIGGNSFSLIVNTLQNESCEAENNDTMELANIINNDTTHASSYKNDVDYFVFNLDQRTTILPQIDFTPIENYDLKLYEIVLEDRYGSAIKSYSYRGSNNLSGKEKSVTLNAGQYFICVSRVEDKTQLDLGIHEYTIYLKK